MGEYFDMLMIAKYGNGICQRKIQMTFGYNISNIDIFTIISTGHMKHIHKCHVIN